jgi:hypothetical protein
MGMALFSRNVYDKPNVVYQTIEKIIQTPVLIPPPPNPNPLNFNIINSLEEGKYLIILIQYPDCTNYEGRKILMYKGIDKAKLLMQGSIDPHFSNNPEKYSPIARFVPTIEGWEMAIALAKTMSK